MKLQKRHLEVIGTAGYFWVQTGHRKTAIDLAIAALGELPAEQDDPLAEAEEFLRAWTMEAVYQGAWVREYHDWETGTKAYFDAMHGRNGSSAPNWRKAHGSHVVKVREQIGLFEAHIPSSLPLIDKTRDRINDVKHDSRYLATADDY